MKSLLKIYLIGFLVLATTFSCTEKLEETPRSVITSDYFETAQGIEAGVTAAYSFFRYFYGNEGFMSLVCFGTDEFTHGRDGTSFAINDYLAGLNAANGNISGQWNNAYAGINTCNGVIQLGPNAENMNAELQTRLIAEAKYLRAHYYFILVQFFGDLSLRLDFNTNPSTEDTRSPKEDVYAAIIEDLKDASVELSDLPADPGRASKATALHLLAKVYLTRAGRLNQTADYDSAYLTAKNLIDNRATYGKELLQDFGLVHAQGDEHNSEILWTVEWNADALYNELGVEQKENRSIYFFRPLYESVPGVMRTIEYGRPWLRFKPINAYLFDVAFAERVNDARYDKTFQTVWLANDEADLPAGMAIGDTALWLPGYEFNSADTVGKLYRAIAPSSYNAEMWPSLNKYDDGNRPDIMAASVRPYIVHKLSETYLIASEAAMMSGRMDEAVEYMNVVRRRAAYRAENTPEQNTAAATAMEITASDLDIDFILDERSRELCGESMRWFDLVRTGKLIERVQQYNAQGGPNIQPHHVLRPIPQTQIDLCTSDYPQNPGYGD